MPKLAYKEITKADKKYYFGLFKDTVLIYHTLIDKQHFWRNYLYKPRGLRVVFCPDAPGPACGILTVCGTGMEATGIQLVCTAVFMSKLV